MTLHQHTTHELTGLANQVINQYVGALENKGIISFDLAKIIIEHQVIVTEKGLFSSYWDKLWGIKKDEMIILVVRVLNNDHEKTEDK